MRADGVRPLPDAADRAARRASHDTFATFTVRQPYRPEPRRWRIPRGLLALVAFGIAWLLALLWAVAR